MQTAFTVQETQEGTKQQHLLNGKHMLIHPFICLVFIAQFLNKGAQLSYLHDNIRNGVHDFIIATRDPQLICQFHLLTWIRI